MDELFSDAMDVSNADDHILTHHGQQYLHDLSHGLPLHTFTFTASGYRDMLTVYSHVSSKAWANGFPKELPTLIYSGDRDPVGSFGKGPKAVYDALKEAGVRDLQLKLYPQGRHEMHNETNQEEVFEDITRWMEQRFGVKKV